jgi:alpha-ketoglutarate-dependent taurine dioxygenase
MKISKIPGLGRFGTFIDDVDFDHLTDEEWMEIGKMHLAGLVTILRNVQNLTEDNFSIRMAEWGEPRHTTNALFQQKYNKSIKEIRQNKNTDSEDLATLAYGWKTNSPTSSGHLLERIQSGYDEDGYPLGVFPEGELGWHANEPSTLSFVPGVALYGNTNMVGSATCVATTPDYYESVSESFRSELDEMQIEYRYDPQAMFPGLNNTIVENAVRWAACPEDGMTVPLVIDSPGGIRGLHYSYSHIFKIKDASKQESQRLLDHFNRELFQKKYVYDHWYQQNNDICLFDNSITAHRRIGSTDGRIAWRFASDYSNLQQGFWQPYKLHPPVARAYIRELQERIPLSHVKEFKMPTWIDYVKTFF